MKSISFLVVILLLLPGCAFVVYGFYDSVTPYRNVSDKSEYWGGYELQAVYELKHDVFMADMGAYSHGMALAPEADFPFKQLRSDGWWRGVTSVEEFRNSPEKWPEMSAIVDAGTKIRCVEIKRRFYFADKSSHTIVFGQLESGSFDGQVVEISELSLHHTKDPEDSSLRPNPQLLEKLVDADKAE